MLGTILSASADTPSATDFSRWREGRLVAFLSRLQPGFSTGTASSAKPAEAGCPISIARRRPPTEVGGKEASAEADERVLARSRAARRDRDESSIAGRTASARPSRAARSLWAAAKRGVAAFRCVVLALIALLLLPTSHSPLASAAEIYSNGTGGGPWSDAATWRGGAVPGEDDDVVIARDDTVVFDRNDDGKVTCHLLSLDPRAVLQFKTNAGPITLVASGTVESYGTIRLDATKAAADRHELRLVAEDPEERALKVPKGGGLVVAGRNVLAKAKKNARIVGVAPPVVDKGATPPDPTAILEAGPGATLDLQRAEFDNVYVQAKGIDNTGAKPGERVNIVKNRFSGTSRVYLESCDTPLVADNVAEREPVPAIQQAAFYFNSCPLAEVRGNVIRGAYPTGISFYGGVDANVVDNLVENCAAGFYYYGTNGMIRRLTLRNTGHALTMTSASGTLEDVLIEKCTSGYYHGGATVQLTNIVIRDMQPTSSYDVYYVSGPLTLLNCDLKPEQIKLHSEPPPKPAPGKPDPPWITALQYLVVQTSGSVPAGSAIDLRTSNPPLVVAPGAADPNVRNVPAPIASSGFTPLPRSLEPIIVRTWMYDNAGKLSQAPDYQLRVLAPEEQGQTERKVLKSTTVTPNIGWHRTNPNDKKPTLEVTVP